MTALVQSSEPLVRVEGVSRSYRRGSEIVSAVRHASFGLWPETLSALIGPSGSGKTTLLNMIVGAEQPDEGHIHGLPDRADWSYLAIVPQAMGLLDELTILENVTLPQRLGVTASMPAIELMGQLGIAHLAERSPSKTSLGEQQRAAVARALLPAPKLVIADEPTSHQDEANAYLLIDAFAASANAGSSILLATHDTRVIDRCDVILGVNDGQVALVRDTPAFNNQH